MMDIDHRFVEMAIDCAAKARQKGNHPFGAVLVDADGNVFQTAENTVITDKDITFSFYHFPFGAKQVNLADVDSIEVLEPTLKNGKWRIWGTGDFRTWFPLDWYRPKRDRIFCMRVRNKKTRIGFTAMDSERVEMILREKELIADKNDS